jgi:antitoxin component YwqK of YwqJK toxin-antitoxin module
MYVYHPSGRIYSKTPYIYGAMHGLAEYFNDDEHSTLLQTRPYVAGQREGTSHLYYPGAARHIHKILNYSRNKLHGQSLVFNPTGVVIQSYNYVEGHLDGLYCEYYDTGVMRLETLFQGGRRRYTNTFNKQGGLMKKTVYN